MSQTGQTAVTTKERPIGVTILAVLAGVLAVIAALRFFQFLFFIPIFGPLHLVGYPFFYLVMEALLVWVWAWLAIALWRVERQAWIFLVIVTMFELIFDFLAMLGSVTWQDVSVPFILSGLILIYCMLPGVREAFGTDM